MDTTPQSPLSGMDAPESVGFPLRGDNVTAGGAKDPPQVCNHRQQRPQGCHNSPHQMVHHRPLPRRRIIPQLPLVGQAHRMTPTGRVAPLEEHQALVGIGHPHLRQRQPLVALGIASEGLQSP